MTVGTTIKDMSGFIGTIVEVEENWVVVRFDRGTAVRSPSQLTIID